MINHRTLRQEFRLLRGNPPLPLAERPTHGLFWATIGVGVVIVVIITVILIAFAGCAYSAPSVDMNIIAKIESNYNPMAYNKHTGATGMYQVTLICIKEYNEYHKNGYEWQIEDMFIYWNCYKVADWYMNIRIPEMLKAYRIADTVHNRLWAYNAGIGMVRKGIMPKETKKYIRTYERLAHG